MDNETIKPCKLCGREPTFTGKVVFHAQSGACPLSLAPDFTPDEWNTLMDSSRAIQTSPPDERERQDKLREHPFQKHTEIMHEYEPQEGN